MKLSLFKKQIILLASVTLVFLFIAIFASLMAVQIDRQNYVASPTRFFARLTDEISKRYNVSTAQAVQLLNETNTHRLFPVQIEILDHPAAARLVGDETLLPKKQYDDVQFGPRDAFHYPRHLIRLDSADEEYLTVYFKPRSSPMHRILNPQSGVMMLSIFLASLLSLFLLFYSMRQKAKLAGEVFNQIRRGDLSARFPVGKMDEVGHLMVEFNKMAEEIQRLVETIRNTELARLRRLQELAHDLRTPVASLKNLLETLQLHRGSMTPESQEEILSLSNKEVDYFARLVEDLLFLAQVTEPKYCVTRTDVNLADLVEDEVESLKARYPKLRVNMKVNGDLDHLKGDEHLLRRMLRNMLENAFSFARSEVVIETQHHDVGLGIVVRDDGPGFHKGALAAFGEKRATRVVSDNSEGRISVGLGSVIMKTVATLHDGSLTARNRDSGGGEVEVVLRA